jgi:pre-mRNA-splicing factor RBM22/SLT11
MATERGLQHKTDNVFQGSERGEFPALCEACLGEGTFVRMIRDSLNGTCKMCNRPFTMFKWRSGHTYKKTEVTNQPDV